MIAKLADPRNVVMSKKKVLRYPAGLVAFKSSLLRDKT